ncbi:MAG: UDP-N-acetylmuramoyl-L-alanine--D-glutamate ligase [Desulfomicrobium escambiense]|nr:UDP-N-acetylmuramoyl-L-alanine--D-glutamate ligase [Desulfomicrobium escambiense]
MELRDKNVLVVGFERTGRAVCRFLLDRGARVRVTDRKPAEFFGDTVRPLAEQGVVFELGGHRPGSFLEADLIVPSPGVPPLAEIRAARDKGVAVVAEIELAFLFLRGLIVGITGTNGKSTTATLVHRMLAEAGLKARLAGNIGTPLVSFVDRSRDDHVYVTEISSFQLAYTERFTPAVSVLLNVSENHLDWHGTFEDYFGAKKKLVLRQGPGGAAVLNRDDRLVWGLAAEAAAAVHGFSRKRRLARGAFVEDGWVVVRGDRTERIAPAARLPLPGAHNLENVLAAALVGRLLGVPAPSLRRSILSFRGLEHRLEDAGRVGRRPLRQRFQGDDRRRDAQSPGQLRPSRRPHPRRARQGRGLLPLRKEVAKKVRSVVLVGEAADKIEAALGGVVPVDRVRDYREVVRTAFARAGRGDVVLLAPACTSWDMFRDFEERGRTFKREVRRLDAGLRKKGANK